MIAAATTQSPAKSHLPGDAAPPALLTRMTSAPFAREVQQNIVLVQQGIRCATPFQSWFWTVTRSSALCDVMDDDTADLIQALCTRAGMIMEDLSAEALTFSGTDSVGIGARLTLLADGAKAVSALIAAASVLSRSSG